MARLPYPNFRSKHTSSQQSTLNVLKILSYSPAIVEHWVNVGDAQFKSLQLSKRDRELVILLSTAKFKSSYEWTHHLPLSLKQGVTKAQQVELEQAGREARYFSKAEVVSFTEKDRVLLAFVEAVIEDGEIAEELWERTRRFFSEREIVEIISLQGFYYTFSRLTTVLDIELDGFAKAKL